MNGNRHTDAYTGANEHIRLNTKLNVTAASPTVAVTIMHKGSSNILKAGVYHTKCLAIRNRKVLTATLTHLYTRF